MHNDITYYYDGLRPDGLITVYAYYNGSPVVELAGRADYRAGIAKVWPVKKLRPGNYNVGMRTLALRDIRNMR